MRNLDQLDLDILAHLFRDAGMTNKDLAALVVLKGAHCEVDYQALGGHIQAMVSLQLARHSRQIIDAFRDAILALPEVISLFHMGGKDDFLVHLCVSDTEHLRNFVFDHFTSREEVVHLETSLVFEHRFSRSLADPCPASLTPERQGSRKKPPVGGFFVSVSLQLRTSLSSGAVW